MLYGAAMAHLERMRQLRRDPAAADPAAPAPFPFGNDAAVDPSGHTFSPSIRMQQKELNNKMAEAPALAAKARAEFEERYSAGFSSWQAGDTDQALEQFAAAYVLSREMNYRAGEADALNMTGVCYKHMGDLERASGVFEGVVQLCSGMKDVPGEAAALGNLGQALAAQKKLGEAETAHTRSLELARGAADKNGELSALFHLGTLRLRARRFAEAEASLASAQVISQALDDVAAEVGVLQRLAAARDMRLRTEQQAEGAEVPRPPPPRRPTSQPDASGSRGVDEASSTAAGADSARSSSAGSGGARFSPGRRSRFVIEPNAELSASLQQRKLAVEPPASTLPPSSPLPPLEPPPPSPLELLQRAEGLTRTLEGSGGPLRMMVLRQLRAQYAQLADDDGVKSCERAIDRLALQPPTGPQIAAPLPAAQAEPTPPKEATGKAAGREEPGGVLV